MRAVEKSQPQAEAGLWHSGVTVVAVAEEVLHEVESFQWEREEDLACLDFAMPMALLDYLGQHQVHQQKGCCFQLGVLSNHHHAYVPRAWA